MILFPNCKINLGLHILNKREDGFHNLETVFYPVGLKDALEIIPSSHSNNEIEFSSSGITIDGNTNDNICIKAYHLLKRDFPQLPSIKMHLHKAIPIGAGLGGGSADGVFTLQLLNTKFKLNLTIAQLINYTAQLGSDCPFFILNCPCYATGRGEILEAINLNLSSYKIVLINPVIHVDTGWAFSQLTPTLPQKSITVIIKQPIETWKAYLKNDFEEVVFKKYPVIKEIKEELYLSGAVYASMSGSGSSVYGIFDKGIDLQKIAVKNYFVKIIS